MSFYMPPDPIKTHNVELERSLFAAADPLIHRAEPLAVLLGDQIIDARSNDGRRGTSANHSQPRRVHEQQGSVFGYDLDALRCGFNHSAELLVGFDFAVLAVRYVHQQVDAADDPSLRI